MWAYTVYDPAHRELGRFFMIRFMDFRYQPVLILCHIDYLTPMHHHPARYLEPHQVVIYMSWHSVADLIPVRHHIFEEALPVLHTEALPDLLCQRAERVDHRLRRESRLLEYLYMFVYQL